MAKRKFYITTPIYYVNDVPHVGHAYTTLAADVLARYHHLLGEEVFFLTGTDEHGLKVAQEVKEQGLSPKEFTDQVAPRFSSAWDSLNIKYDFFIRTTNRNHEKIVQKVLTKLRRKGFIYEGVYEGPYCVGCEKFLTEDELQEGVCPFHPNLLPTRIKEKNYFFKLSHFQEKLNRLFSSKEVILPKERRNEILGKLKEGLKDVSVSRAGVPWGIPVPWDKKQTVYVWVDALLNYYSATQFVKGKKKFWPADLHLIGKDILWFHTVVWYALLLAAGFLRRELPEKVFAHGFFTIEGQKISKSMGNVIAPADLIEQFGVDGTRYLLLSEFPFGADGDISLGRFKERYNADLANGVGNLVARVAKLCERVERFEKPPKFGFSDEVKKQLDRIRPDLALEYIKLCVSSLDSYIDKKRPWDLDGKKLKDTLRTIIIGKEARRGLLQIAHDLRPFTPETAEKIQKEFTSPKIKAGPPLFPRL